MFQEFYLRLVPNFMIERKEVCSVFELMAQDDFMGYETMEKQLFPVMGVVHVEQESLIPGMQEKINPYHKIIKDYHNQIFDILSEKQYYVKLTTFLPYLMLFFIVHLNHQLKQRHDIFKKLLDPYAKTSLIACFQRAGLKPISFN